MNGFLEPRDDLVPRDAVPERRRVGIQGEGRKLSHGAAARGWDSEPRLRSALRPQLCVREPAGSGALFSPGMRGLASPLRPPLFSATAVPEGTGLERDRFQNPSSSLAGLAVVSIWKILPLQQGFRS